MAAVLCKGCAAACEGLCKLMTIPCKICGECCGLLTEGIAQLCTNPFCLFVAVSLAINIPSIVAGLNLLRFYGIGCMASTWQIGNVAFCSINIIAAFYIAMRFNHLKNNPRDSSSGTNTQSSGMRKVSDILCYDPIVAIYILVLIGFFIWLGIGVSWRASGQMWCGDDAGIDLINTSFACGYSFFGTGFFALCFSICCSCCCNDDGSRGHGTNPYYSQQPQRQYGSTPTNRPPPHQRPPSNNYSGSNHSNQYPKHNDVEHATAEPVTATPVYSQNQQQAPIKATVVNDTPAPSAPPASAQASSNENNSGLSIDQEAEAVAKGSAFGAKIGKLFNASDTTKSKLETAGAKANLAVNQSLTKAQQMMGFKKN